jgi:hypothetical protein
MRGTLILMGLLSCAAHKALAQTQEYVIDATAAVSPPETGFLKLGTANRGCRSWESFITHAFQKTSGKKKS